MIEEGKLKEVEWEKEELWIEIKALARQLIAA
jgi:hypothetical protein